MDYSALSKEELIKIIEESRIANQLIFEKTEKVLRLNFPWANNLGYWCNNLKMNTINLDLLHLLSLGYSKEEIPYPVTVDYFNSKIHPEDRPKVKEAFNAHLRGKTEIYECEFRIQAKDGSYKWYYDRGKITQYDQNGEPLFVTGICFDITVIKEMQIDLEMKKLLLHEQDKVDPLTKICNYKTLIQKLKSALLVALTTKMPLSVAILDIDDFKGVNDTIGHLNGDRILVDVASNIKSCLRKTDLVGRHSGEEFMIILPNTNLADAAFVMERIRYSIEKYRFIHGTHVTISGGVKEFCGETLSELVDATYANLYKAKGQGKNSIHFRTK